MLIDRVDYAKQYELESIVAVTEQRIPKTENFQFDHKFSREDNNNCNN